ncbi:MAG: phosphotransferase [Nanoarchaeota archaeon]|nr:phosphotransferase [Nanoarchaeota archaeon]
MDLDLEQDEVFENIISFDSRFNYEKLPTNNKFKSEVYLVSSSKFDDKYVYKIFSRGKKEYELIKKVILELNVNKYSTPILYYYKYDDLSAKVHFIFEYIVSDQKFDINDKSHLDNFFNLLIDFYNLTGQLSGENRNDYIISKIKKVEKCLSEDYLNRKVFEFIKKDLKELMGENRVILRDINPTNILISKGNFYLIDFDEVAFGEIECDLADIYLNFTLAKSVLENIGFLSELKLRLESKLDFSKNLNSDKIIYYLILILYHEIFFIFETNSQKLFNLKKIKFFFENREFLSKKINSI